MRNIFQAVTGSPPLYPVVPAIWPNRSIRRALRFAKDIPAQWFSFFEANPEHRKLALAQAKR